MSSAVTAASNPSPAPVSEQTAATEKPMSSPPAGSYNYAAAPIPTVPIAYTGIAASLYVGELHPDVNEAILFEHFSQVGPVASIRVCRDTITRRSLGYAYVNFHSAMDAERAIEGLNYSLIRDRPCRIMWSQRDPSQRKLGNGNIFIKNLDVSVDNKALHDTFSAFGNVLSCKVVCDENTGLSKGFAFVHFENQEAADKAIAKVNGKMLNGKIVFVGRYMSKKERQPKIDEAKSRYTNVFIKNLDVSVTDDEFLKLVEPYGNIISAVIQKDEAGVSKGFGFVNFECHESAEKAVTELHGKLFKDKEVYACRAQLKTERIEELKRIYESMREEKGTKFCNLYVKNLDDEIDNDKLMAEFEPFGPITSCVVMRDEKGTSKGFGFVCFKNPTDAAKAMADLNGKLLSGKPLYVALAQRKDERKMQLEAQYAQRMMKQYAAPVFYPGATMPRPGFAFPMQGMMPRVPGRMMPGVYPPQMLAASATNVMGANMAMAGGVPRMPNATVGVSGRPNRMANATGPNQSGNKMGPGAPNGQGMGQRTGEHRPRTDRNGHQMNVNNRYGAAGHRMNSGHANNAVGISGGGVSGMYPSHQTPDLSVLNSAVLAAASPEDQKRMLGERLYRLVYTKEPELAGKITGMLLEMDNGEILHLLESPDSLNMKVDEALDVIRRYHMNQQQQSQPQQTPVQTTQ